MVMVKQWVVGFGGGVVFAVADRVGHRGARDGGATGATAHARVRARVGGGAGRGDGQYRRESRERCAPSPPRACISASRRDSLRKVSPWRAPGPPCAAS